MIVNNVILIFLLFDFNFQYINSQIKSSLYTRKNVINQYDGSGNDQENATQYTNTRLLTPDDEDSVRLANSKSIQSSGDGFPKLPDVYPSLNPYTASRSTATILVDISIVKEYKSYMLPGSNLTPMLQQFHNEITENLKTELKSIKADLGFHIISLRPGPLVKSNTSVFARVNITQHNSSIVNPMIIFHISHCGRLGKLGKLNISEQIIFPQYVCASNEVYCLPDCKKGAYCDGKKDCPNTALDETPSCPKCLYKDLRLITNSNSLNEGENLILLCEFKENCGNLQHKLQWSFPDSLKQYEMLFKGQKSINSFPKNEITSGIYRCKLDGDSAVKNITVFKKPRVLITNTDADAELVLITQLENSNLDMWCNTTDGYAQWIPTDSTLGSITQSDRQHSKITLQNLSETTTIQCQVRWGFEERGQILKTVKINVMCNPQTQFSCTNPSKKLCIPIEQKCDTIRQCDDGLDETGCVYCSEKSLHVDTGQHVVKDLGETVIMTCSASQDACYPLKWMKDNKPLVNNGNLVVYKNSVFVLNVSSEYSGIYQCMAASNRGIDVTIFVNEPPRLKLDPDVSVINMTYGQSKEIDCSIVESRNSNHQNLRPIWSFNKNEMIPDNVQLSFKGKQKVSIMFNRVTETMEGEYRCEVNWGLGTNKKYSVAVRVNVLPVVCNAGEKMCLDKTMCIPESMWCDGQKQCIDASDEDMCTKCRNGFVFVQPSNLVILSKESAQITCYYHQECYPVEWRITNSKMPVESVNGITVIDNKLLLNNVGMDAANSYECYSGEKTSQVNVTVINEIEITFIDNPAYAFVDFGRDVEVNCQTNYGKPVWRKRDFKSVEEISGAKQTYIEPNIARLTIRSASYDARGYYNCSVRSLISNKEVGRKLLYIHVYDLECQDNFIKCDQNTKCIPKDKICDSINDCDDKEDEKNCSQCIYDLEIKPKMLTLSRSGWGNFQCLVPNKDCLPIDWKTKNGQPLRPGFYKYNDSLFIFNSELRDNEEIVCTNGKKSASAFLTVKDIDLSIVPNQPENSILYVKRGDSRIIECRSNLGTPQWIHPKEDSIQNNGVHYVNKSPNVTIIQMEKITEEASGNYVCSVTFSRETKKKTVSIKVI